MTTPTSKGAMVVALQSAAKGAAKAATEVAEQVGEFYSQTAAKVEQAVAKTVEADAATAERYTQLKDPATGRFIKDPNRPASDAPEWTSSDRRKAWRNLVNDPNSPLTPAQRQEIRANGWQGPQRVNPYTGETETMELSHEPVSRADGGTTVVPRWQDDHAAVDPQRYLKGNRTPNQPLDDEP